MARWFQTDTYARFVLRALGLIWERLGRLVAVVPNSAVLILRAEDRKRARRLKLVM